MIPVCMTHSVASRFLQRYMQSQSLNHGCLSYRIAAALITQHLSCQMSCHVRCLDQGLYQQVLDFLRSTPLLARAPCLAAVIRGIAGVSHLVVTDFPNQIRIKSCFVMFHFLGFPPPFRGRVRPHASLRLCRRLLAGQMLPARNVSGPFARWALQLQREPSSILQLDVARGRRASSGQGPAFEATLVSVHGSQ